MKFEKVRFAIIPLLLFTTGVYAQAPSSVYRDYISNVISWNKLAICGKIYNQLGYQLDFEYRRQADPEHPAEFNTTVGNSKSNLFKNPFQYASRFWLNYQANKTVVLSVSPIAWFGTWVAPVDEKISFQPEYRSSFQVSLNQNIGLLSINHRFRYELRFFGTRTIDETNSIFGPVSSYDFPNANRQTRFRYMIRGMLPLNAQKIEQGTLYSYANTEFFIRAGENVKNNQLFDQFRSAIGLGYKLPYDMRIELGYMNILAFRLNNKAQNNVDLNHVICLNFFFDDFHKLFKKTATQ